MLAVCLYRLYTGLYVSGMVISPVHWFVCKRNGYIACTLICMGLCLLYSGLYVSGMVTSPVHWFLCKRNNGCYFADFHFQPETQRNLRLTIDALRGKRPDSLQTYVPVQLTNTITPVRGPEIGC